MKNKEKYDLREIDYKIAKFPVLRELDLRIRHNGKTIREITIPYEEEEKILSYYHDWLESEAE